MEMKDPVCKIGGGLFYFQVKLFLAIPGMCAALSLPHADRPEIAMPCGLQAALLGFCK